MLKGLNAPLFRTCPNPDFHYTALKQSLYLALSCAHDGTINNVKTLRFTRSGIKLFPLFAYSELRISCIAYTVSVRHLRIALCQACHMKDNETG